MWSVENETQLSTARKLQIEEYVPKQLLSLKNPQTDIPRIAKDSRLIGLIEDAIRYIPTQHHLYRRKDGSSKFGMASQGLLPKTIPHPIR